VAVEDLECLDDEVVGLLEVAGVREDLPVRELLRRLALARRGGRQAGEDAFGVGLRAAGQEAEASELGGEIVEQQAGTRAIRLGRGTAGVVSGPAGDVRSSWSGLLDT
jgi:hypothetical protein